MEKDWLGLPFRPISEMYRSIFHRKVYKIPVTMVDTCPNRMGLKGMRTCIFCDQWGSAADASSQGQALLEQIKKHRERLQRKMKAEAFLVYFQAYTNTFTKISSLRANLELAISQSQSQSTESSNIVGVVIGTRPDCISPAVLNLWQEFASRTKVFIELGVQSFSDSDLQFYQRGHTHQQTMKAIDAIAKLHQVDLGIHLIFGAPGETLTQAQDSAKICNQLPVSNVKLHNLHVLKGTELELLHAQGKFQAIEFEEYCEKVQAFLEELSPATYVHRLAAYAPRWDELIAPAWTADKMKSHQGIVDWLRSKQSYQSRRFNANLPHLQSLQTELQSRATPKSISEKPSRPFTLGI